MQLVDNYVRACGGEPDSTAPDRIALERLADAIEDTTKNGDEW